MNKEEILEKSKKQNKNKDPFEQHVIAEGCKKSYLVGIVIAFMLYTIESFCNHTQNYAVIAVLTSMCCTLFIYKYVKIKKVEDLICGIIFAISAIGFIILQILTLAGVMK